MKRMIIILLMTLAVIKVWSQESYDPVRKIKEDRNFRIPLIGENAPSFTAESTNGTINFPDDFGRKWKILFSHPADFTPVCTTEIMQLAEMQDQLDKLGIKIAVVSTDALSTHKQWKTSMESLKLNSKEAVKINFPLVEDDNKVISKKYGMIHPASNTTKAVRGVFIIDPDNVIQAIYFYPSRVGRNTDELIRTVTALKATASGQILTPVNWQAGNDVLVPYPPKTDQTGKPIELDGYYSPVWYLWFKKANTLRETSYQSAN